MRTLFFLALVACAETTTSPDPTSVEESGLEPAIATLRSGADATWGPATSAERVWEVSADWADTDAAAGLAWGANSGLSWDEKYRAWVDGLGTIQSDDTHQTAALTTPWGRTLPLNRLECAETALVLRATFAAWHGLPFFATAYSPSAGQNVHYGHFGMVTSGGSALSWQPAFYNYEDYNDDFAGMTDAQILADWPDDSSLEGMSITIQNDDQNDFLGPDQFSGAYFDEIFLNKRAGRFLMALLADFGSIHLAHSTNLFDVQPEALSPGDVLVERWGTTGVGHTLLVKEVTDHGNGTADVELLSGSMPRVQPRWLNDAVSKSYFFSRYTGGAEIHAGTGEPYVTYGGGLKRWRTPVYEAGAWVNRVPDVDLDVFIDPSDTLALTDRLATFELMLGDLTPEDERDSLLQSIQVAREALQERPASCANRERREQSFERLYTVMEDGFGWSRGLTDATYRELDDYVFAELEYTASPTCCWNSSTDEMYDVVMDLVTEDLDNAEAAGQCDEPRVFHMENGGYADFAAYASATGRTWVPWSADESCPQQGASDDTIISAPFTDWCAIDDVCMPVSEVCDGSDNDCDGLVDEGCPTDPVDPDPQPDPPDDSGCSSSLLSMIGGFSGVFSRR